MSERDQDARRRADRRRWIKEHHPDTGGDPALFVARFPGRRAARDGRPVVRPTRRWKRLLRSLRKRFKPTRRRSGRVR